MKPLFIEVGAGELFDKITILQIKKERIKDEKKLVNILGELAILEEVAKKIPSSVELMKFNKELKTINEKLWDIEEGKRQCEREQRFDAHFIALARRVYLDNDERARIKREINSLTESTIVEEKSY
jgi:hypothetical protein